MGKFRTIVLFDIDYTLFRTDLYRSHLYPLLAKKIAMPTEEFLIFAKKAEEEMKVTYGHFAPDYFLQVVSSKSNGQISFSELEEIFWDKGVYEVSLDPQVKEVFTSLQEKDIAIGILSTGDTKHQLAKIQSISSYLHPDSFHIFRNKLLELPSVLQKYEDDTIYVVDDLLDLLQKAKTTDPNVITIHRKREDKEDSLSGYTPDWTVTKLSEITSIVK